MKRVILTVASIIAFSGLASAGNIPVASATVKFTFKPSNNVGSSYFIDTGKMNYVANTKHTAGNRVYSSTNNTSNVWYKEADSYKGQTLADTSVGETNPGESTYGGWTSQ